MRRKREHDAEKENGERWLLTYADLITLLMIFFVVLYSMSKVDAQKFQAVAESLSKALGGGTLTNVNLSSNPNTDPSTRAANKNTDQGNADAENMSIDTIKAKLDKFAADNGIQATLVTSTEERGLVVSIQETLLFESSSADITAQAREILEKISTVLASAPNQIRVEGHTDNLPIHTSQFASNWELSVIRATNVVQILQGYGITAHRLSASGYGEYRPLASNDADTGRGKNRRIDLVILRSKYDLTEPSNQTSASNPLSSTETVKP